MARQLETNRRAYIDLLRTLAILLVLFNHTKNNGFTLFTNRTDSVLFPVYLFCAIFCKIAVPLFFMISGALLLGKEENFSDIIKRRFLKYAVVLFVVSFVTYVLKNHNASLSIKDFLRRIYSSNIATALWFLYAYLGFILMLPLLRKMVKIMEAKDYLWLTGIMLLFSSLRILQFLLFEESISYNSSFAVPLTGKTIYYPLMGYFLANKLDSQKLNGKIILRGILLSVAAIGICGYLTCRWCQYLGEWENGSCQLFFEELSYVPASTVFITVMYICQKISLRPCIEKIIDILGSSTFGVYLFEFFYRKYTEVVFQVLSTYIPTFLACIIWVFCAFLLGVAVTQMLKRIPVVRNFL